MSWVSQERLLQKPCWFSLKILYLPKCVIILLWMTVDDMFQQLAAVMEMRDT